jgi:serine/threonine-protein kinase
METGIVISLHNKLILNSDVVIDAASGLALRGVSEKLHEEFVVTRVKSRAASLTVNDHAVEVLLAFSTPCSVLNAVKLLAKRGSTTPDRILDDMYETLRTFVDRRILVRVGSAYSGVRAQKIGGWKLQRRINDFEDTSVFLVKDDCGRFGALKLARSKVAEKALNRERQIFESGFDNIAPALLDVGVGSLGPYIVSEWKAGLPATDVFSELRSTASQRQLLEAALKIIQLFERLHDQGIIHGDIQPKNVVFDLQNEAWLIDFSHSTIPGYESPATRMGVAFFFEPEYAESLLKQSKPSLATQSGEIYAIGAMIYYLLAGVHYIEFSLERDTLLSQILNESKRPLLDPAKNLWTGPDRVLDWCLSKEPGDRPAGLSVVTTAIEEVLKEEPSESRFVPTIRTQPKVYLGFCAEKELKARFGLESPLLREFALEAPQCSLAYGAAGIAYALTRASVLTQDEELVWAADAWIEIAEKNASNPGAFTSAELGVTRRTIGFASLSNAEPGLWYTKSIIRATLGDGSGTHAAIHKFLTTAKIRRSHMADVNLGGLGLALAAKRLSKLPINPKTREELLAFSLERVSRAWEFAKPINAGKALLGFAHGAAGLAYTSLVCGDTSNSLQLMDDLTRIAECQRRGLRWPVRSKTNFFMPGWCNGVAGHLLLWSKVWQRFARVEDREVLERIAWGVWESRTNLGNICCGAAGQAMILSCFANVVDDPTWRKRSADLLAFATPIWTKQDHPQSLFRGELGLLLARLECNPGLPTEFPVYGSDVLPEGR